MIFTDTHTHLYLDAFDEDRTHVVEEAIRQDVRYILLPNIDSKSMRPMLNLCDEFPENCFPMLGLHPTSVKENYKEELKTIGKKIAERKFIAIGEIGIDLYWDKTFRKQQEEAFRFQIDLALQHELPIVIHSRESFDEIFSILEDYRNTGIEGVFHCFTGSFAQAQHAIDLGFYISISGIVSFHQAQNVRNMASNVPLEWLLIETDSPWLSPTPYRGKVNYPGRVHRVAETLAEIREESLQTIAQATYANAGKLFNLENAVEREKDAYELDVHGKIKNTVVT